MALPDHIARNPWSTPWARRMPAAAYPDTRVFLTARRMIRDHQPYDVSGLGFTSPVDRSRGYRTAALLLSTAVIGPTYSLFLVPRDAIAHLMSAWWPVFVLLVVLWQAGLVWLLTRLLALQSDAPGRP